MKEGWKQVTAPDGKLYWFDPAASYEQIEGVMMKLYPPGRPIQPRTLTPKEQAHLQKLQEDV